MSNIKRAVGKTLVKPLNTTLFLVGATFLGGWYLPDINKDDLLPTTPEQNAQALARIDQSFDRIDQLRQKFSAASTASVEYALSGNNAAAQKSREEMKRIDRKAEIVTQDILKRTYLSPHLTNENYDSISERLEDNDDLALNIRFSANDIYSFGSYSYAEQASVDSEYYQSCRMRIHQSMSSSDNTSPLSRARDVHSCMAQSNDTGKHAALFVVIFTLLGVLRGMGDTDIKKWSRLPKKTKHPISGN